MFDSQTETLRNNRLDASALAGNIASYTNTRERLRKAFSTFDTVASNIINQSDWSEGQKETALSELRGYLDEMFDQINDLPDSELHSMKMEVEE